MNRSAIRAWVSLALALLAPAGQAQPWRFVVIGDTRDSVYGPNTSIVEEIAAAVTSDAPALVIATGDLVYGNPATAAELRAWTNALGAVYDAGIPVYPVRGNHDVGTGWHVVFGPGIPDNGPATESNYTFAVSYSNALVIGLDTYTRLHRVRNPWLADILATNAQPHVFTFSHEPAFKLGHADCMDDYPTNRNTFWSHLVNAGSRVYFAGHDHFFDHARMDDGDGTLANDVHQWIVGIGGGPLYADGLYDGDNGIYTPVRTMHAAEYGYVLVTIDGPEARLDMKTRRAPTVYQVAHTFTYSLDDTDDDGIRDDWERHHFGSLTNASASTDWDADGFGDYDEYRAGTDPTNAASRLVIGSAVTDPDHRITLRWASVSNRVYTVQQTAPIDASTWTPTGTGQVATPPTNTITLSTGTNRQGFLRINVDE